MGPPSPNLVTHSATNFDNAINDLEKALTTHNRVLPEVRNPAKNLITASKQYMESLQQEISNVKSQQSLNNNFSTYLEKIISVINSNNDEKNQTLANIAEMVTKMQSSLNNNATTPTYSAAVTNNKPVQPTMKTILVRSENTQPKDIKNIICHSINPDNMNCKEILINKTNVAFKFLNVTGMNKFTKELKSNDSTKIFTAYEPSPKCPTIQIKNIDYSVPQSEFINKLISQNNLTEYKNNIKLLFTIKRKNYYNAIICVSPHLYHKIINSPIVVGWTASHTEEIFLLGHCNKCLSFSHKTRDCQNNTKCCNKCSSSHSHTPSDNSPSPFLTHIKNCNTIFCKPCAEKNLPSNHSPLSETCPIYIRRVENIQKQTSYDQSIVVKFFTKNPPQMPNSTPITPTNENDKNNPM